MVAGAALAFGSVTACSDDSTASAPITSEPVTTTSMYASGSSATSSAPSSAAESPDDASATTTAPRGSADDLPATAPPTRTQGNDGNTNGGSGGGGAITGPGGQQLSGKPAKYLQRLKSQRVEFMGDTDNGVALDVAEYICAQQRKGTDPTTVRAYVTAFVGPGTKNVAEANSKADKVISAARDEYC
ncbi:hypothetical protein GCM10009624_27740 [Gordonia sinesedis]